MPSHHPRPPLSRRGFLMAGAGVAAALGLLPSSPARADDGPRPFGRYGSPAHRLTPRTLYVDPHGRGDHTSVQAAVTAAGGTSQASSLGGNSGWTLVVAPGTYRETVVVDATRTETTWIGASEDPRDVVIVYDCQSFRTGSRKDRVAPAEAV